MKTLRLFGLLLVGAAATAGAQQPPVGKDDVPAEYMPPKGMCRIWLKDVPPKQQPAPTDCPAAIKNVPPNGRVIFGEEKKEKPKPDTLPSTVKGYTGRGGPPPVVIKKPPR
jgi:hypothetical protein